MKVDWEMLRWKPYLLPGVLFSKNPPAFYVKLLCNSVFPFSKVLSISWEEKKPQTKPWKTSAHFLYMFSWHLPCSSGFFVVGPRCEICLLSCFTQSAKQTILENAPGDWTSASQKVNLFNINSLQLPVPTLVGGWWNRFSRLTFQHAISEM